MVEAADKKAKEAEKRKDTDGMKALLMESNASRDIGMKALFMESNASRDKSKRIKEKDLPVHDKEIKEIEQKLKGLD